MDSIGKYLKTVREEKNITLEKVSGISKIKTRFLRDIENDIFENLGGRGYAKATLTSYAKTIGADEKAVLLTFEKVYKNKSGHISRFDSIQPKKILIPTTIFSIMLLIALIVVLVFVTLKYYPSWSAKSPFKKKIQVETKQETKEEMQVDEIKKPVEPEEKPIPANKTDQPKKTENEESSLNAEALNDTVDYVDSFIFEGKESSLNFKDR
ncbi:MAG: helix-turn-helix domain-containing protein [Candidatus Cloacimonetes bacterium]|nr:helix-turn-helix domain-containing protein [Candidatus Cloacimonadota bacterium]